MSCRGSGVVSGTGSCAQVSVNALARVTRSFPSRGWPLPTCDRSRRASSQGYAVGRHGDDVRDLSQSFNTMALKGLVAADSPVHESPIVIRQLEACVPSLTLMMMMTASSACAIQSVRPCVCASLPPSLVVYCFER